ncbi:MAG: C-terminal target protein [Crocinitomicaceae bacterium]|jgi:hypothetical protein|nr:C-terminal target protein [Crocinitomicaceae bacterium]
MKKLLLSLTVFVSLSLQAQNPITITTGDLPSIGTGFINIQELNLQGIYPGDPGANQAYDISGFQNSGEDSIFFLDPAQTMYADEFENATITRYLATDTSYAFMIEGETKVEIEGLVMNVPGIAEKAVAKASDPLTQFTFPMTYETAFDDLAAFSTNSVYFHQVISEDPYTYFDSARLNITYDRSSVVDGWGTLATPFGTTFSVLRQRVEDITVYAPEFYLFYVDTLFGTPVTIPLGWQTIPGAEMNDTTTTYYYLANTDSGNPLILAELQENTSGSIISAQYAKLPMAAIDELSLSNVFVFPNPAADYVELKSPVRLNSVRMLGSDGKTVFTTEVNNNTATIDLTALATGIYTLIIDTEKGQEIKRVSKL